MNKVLRVFLPTLEILAEKVDKTCIRNYIDFSTDKTKLTANSANGIHREIKVKCQKLGNVINFKYLLAFVSDEGLKQEVLSNTASATAALTKVKPI